MKPRIMRSVNRDAQTMRLGLPTIQAEIRKLESQKKKDRSVKKRLERLRAAQQHLINSPKESKSLVDQLKEINNDDKK
tara:strand:+ start:96 stop:329 length:234 start_codon:yes stop_codon:yes gene_type:complete